MKNDIQIPKLEKIILAELKKWDLWGDLKLITESHLKKSIAHSIYTIVDRAIGHAKLVIDNSRKQITSNDCKLQRNFLECEKHHRRTCGCSNCPDNKNAKC